MRSIVWISNRHYSWRKTTCGAGKNTSGTPPLLPKLKFFLWKIATNTLPTGANLQTRGLLTNTGCPRCGEVETIDHILFHCAFAKEVWTFGLWASPMDDGDIVTFKDTLQASFKWINLPPIGVTTNLFPWICWNLWTARNLLTFENRTLSPHEVVLKATRASKEWEMAQPCHRPTPSPPITQRHAAETPSPTTFCNTDAS